MSLFLMLALMLLQLAVVASISGLGMRLRGALLLLAASGLVFGAAFAVRGGWVAGLRDLSLLSGAASLGYIISFLIREPNILAPVAICAALVDWWNVSLGPLGRLVATRPEVVEKVAVQMPAAGVPLMMGMGDVIFLAIFFSVLFRFRMNVKGAFWLGFVLLVLSMFAVMIPSVGALPALVPIGIAVLATNAKYFKLNREEQLATLYVGLLLLALLAASYLVHRG
ncbi:MAG: hypothetical protein ACYC2Y_02855 [Armatimonadota bacterium]